MAEADSEPEVEVVSEPASPGKRDQGPVKKPATRPAIPAAMQINNWVGTATFDGTAEAAFSLSNGTDTYAASLIP